MNKKGRSCEDKGVREGYGEGCVVMGEEKRLRERDERDSVYCEEHLSGKWERKVVWREKGMRRGCRMTVYDVREDEKH